MIALAGYRYSVYKLLVVYVLLYHLYSPGENMILKCNYFLLFFKTKFLILFKTVIFLLHGKH